MPWRAAALAAALAAAALTAAYSASTPAFEAPDEPGHFRYVEALAGGQGLPIQGRAGDYDPEFSQPPLYYALEAGVARLVPAAGAPVPAFAHQNAYQNTTPSGNVNLYSHPAAEGFPWTGQILQLHAMRLANLLFAAVTLAATYGIARALCLGPWPALAAAATLGLLPQCDFIAGALNADNAVTAFSAAALFLLLRGLGRMGSPRAGLLLGMVTAAAMLSKLSGLVVLPLAVGFLLWRAWRERKPALAAEAAVATATAALLAGWWYVRNLVLYGDALGWQPMLSAIGAMLRPRPLTAWQAAVALLAQAPTAVGVFGWNNVRLPSWAYAIAAALAALAALGLLRWAAAEVSRRPSEAPAVPETASGALSTVGMARWAAAVVFRRDRVVGARAAAPARTGSGALAGAASAGFGDPSPAASLVPAPSSTSAEQSLPKTAGPSTARLAAVVLLAVWALAFAASLVRWVEVNTDAAQWRLLLPAFPALAVLLVLGLSRLWWVLAAAAPLALAGLSAGGLLLVLRPAYLAETAYAGSIQHQVHARFGDALELAGYDDPPRAVAPGQPLTLTLYWRALAPIALDDAVDLVGLDAAGQQALKQSTWPQDGRAPTSTWRPGELIRDVHTLPAPAAPGAYTLYVDVFQPVPYAPRLPLAGGGSTLTLGRTLVAPPRAPAAAAEATFGGSLALLAHRAPSAREVDLEWQVLRPLGRDYTVFVHVLDPGDKLVAQSDSQPDGGRFPTSLLPAGSQLTDHHSLPVPAASGDRLEIGVYDAQTGARLALDGSGADALTLQL